MVVHYFGLDEGEEKGESWLYWISLTSLLKLWQKKLRSTLSYQNIQSCHAKLIILPSRNGRVVKYAVLWHGRSGFEPWLRPHHHQCLWIHLTATCMWVKVDQPPCYTCLYSVHIHWWKRKVLHKMWPSESLHTGKKECRQEIHSGFETHEEGHIKSKTAISGSTKWALVQ